MLRHVYFWSMGVLVLMFALALTAYAQLDSATPAPPDAPKPSDNPAPPRSDDGNAPDRPVLRKKSAPETQAQNSTAKGANDSSSRSTMIDISPPIGDAQEHPDSEIPEELSTNEVHPWNPHRAEKDVEVGDYYFKEKNYRGAESRYRDALLYKPNDAVATFRLGQVMEKSGRVIEAQKFYEDYLKIMPHGPYANESHKALQHLQAESNGPAKTDH